MQYISASHALFAFSEVKFSYFIKRKGRLENSCFNSHGESHFGRTDVIIVGAGVAGSALAHTLGKDGRRVRVIERNLNEPDTFAGELLQPAGYLKLRELGLADCVRGIDAQLVLGYVFHKDEKSIRIPFPFEKYDSDIAGRGFHHGRFVQGMRRKAASLSNVKLEQGTATSLIEEGGTIKGIKYTTSNGQELTAYAPLTIICDGCFSRLRKYLAKPKVVKPSTVVGLAVENCKNPHPGYAHLTIGNPSNLVMYPISSTEVRFLIDFPGTNLPSISNGQMAHYLKNVVAPMLPPELFSAFISSVDKGKIRTMPISCMTASPCLMPGALLLGDALNMRHALGGGGMTVALHDISLLTHLFRSLNLHDTAVVMKCTAHFYNMRKPMAFTLNVVSDSIYKLVYAIPDEIKEDVLEACFNYLSSGFSFPFGLVGLLSGLYPQPWRFLLFLSFAGLHVTADLLLPLPSATRIYAAARFASVAADVFVPFLLEEGLHHVFLPLKSL